MKFARKTKGWIESKLEVSHGDNPSMLSMEGLRGVAVFLVFWVHFSSLIRPWTSGFTHNILEFVLKFGHCGVDLFFVLSGFLIYGSIMKRENFDAIKYAKRRVLRIYPTFLVVFFIYLILSFVFPNESKLPSGVWGALTYVVQNLLLLPGIFKVRAIVTVAWSLSFEAFYYIVIPPLIFGLRLKSWPVNARIALWMAVAVVGIALPIPRIRLIMFVAGILLYELYHVRRVAPSSWGTSCLIISLLLYGSSHFVNISPSILIATMFVLFIWFCLCAFNPRSPSYKWLVYTPLRWLGNMSYSYYLIHGLTLKFYFLIFGRIVSADYSSELLYYWFWIPAFCLTCLTSFGLFWLVERPFSLTRQKTRMGWKSSNKNRQNSGEPIADAPISQIDP